MSDDDHAPLVVGVFRIGATHYGLPVAHLREVARHGELSRLADGGGTLVGAARLRGELIAVADTTRILPDGSAAGDVLVVATYAARVLGLRCDEVAGLVEVDRAGALDLGARSDGELVSIAFESAELRAVVNVLEPAALFAAARAPGRAAIADTQRAAAEVDDVRHMVFFTSGDLHLALESAFVETTLFDPKLEPSSLAGGSCLGTLVHAGRRLAAVDLARHCGLGQLGDPTRCHAFVAVLDEGPLALVVDRIDDVALVARAREQPLSVHGRAVLATVRSAFSVDGASRLVVDADALAASDELRTYARLHQAIDEPLDASVHARADSSAQTMLFFEAGRPAAVPIADVAELLPWDDERLRPSATIGPRDFVDHRGRLVPVYCLSRLIDDAADDPPSDSACILLVRDGDRLVGFAVPRLVGLERVGRMPLHDTRALAVSDAPPPSWRALELVTSGTGRHAVETLDLAALVELLAAAAA